ncbi:extracellular matrix protein 2-like [Pelobates fuscus]|uniref:extracellular matrix protein 2-like n=1 Tax=Pelobates fuscus TaxID=191477 RepID=UPI002FE49DEF
MKLLFVALALSVLEFTGRAQRSQGQLRNTTGLQKTPQKRPRPFLAKAKDSQWTQKVSKQGSTGQRMVTPAVQNSKQLENTLVAGRGQCLVNGIAMFDGAAWSPQPCTMCICDLGKQVCEPISCEMIACSSGELQTSPGTCCPICVKTETPTLRVSLPTPKPTQGNVKEVKIEKQNTPKHIKPTKGKELRVKQSKPGNGVSTTSQVSAVPKKVPMKRSEATKPGEVQKNNHNKKKEPNNDKQETSDQKIDVDTMIAKKEQNKKKESDVENPKVLEKEPPAEEKTKSPGISKESPRPPNGGKKMKDRLEKNKKSVTVDNLSVTPTVPVIQPPVHPTDNYIPSLPSGCLLSESTIACASTKMKYLPLMTDPGLKTLYLADNEISKLPARAFSGLPNLEWLDLSKNMLGESGLAVDVFKNLTKLKRLNLDGNNLTVLPLLPQSLQELKVNDNKLQELHRYSFRGLSNLLTLQLEGNGFHDGNVYPLTFKPLKKLIYLRLDRNKFRAIPSGLPASLQELHLDNNRIEIVSEGILNKTLNLSILVLSNNRLQENHIAPRAWIDLLNLESLDLSNNHIVHVPSFLPRGLKQLILHHNQIELIPGYVFAHMKPGLEFLHLSHNHLKDDGIHAVSFFGLYKSLNELLLDNNLLLSIPRGMLSLKALQVLRLSFNKIRYVPLNSICDTRISEDSSLVSVHLEHNFINRHLIPPTAFSCIKTYHSVILRPQNGEYEDYY